MPKKNERGFNVVGSKYEDMKNFYTTFTEINTDGMVCTFHFNKT